MNLLPRITLGNEHLKQSIENEWRTLPYFDIPSDIKNHLDEPDIFWNKLSNLKLMNEEFPFKNLSTFPLDVLSLPHFNAYCEQVFSKINLIKVNQGIG